LQDILVYREQWKTEELRYNTLVQDEIRYLTERIDANRAKREEDADAFLRNLNEDSGRISRHLMEEKKAREENENLFVKRLEEMCSHSQEKLQEERRERQAAEQRFMDVLEKTCARLETKMSQNKLRHQPLNTASSRLLLHPQSRYSESPLVRSANLALPAPTPSPAHFDDYDVNVDGVIDRAEWYARQGTR